jgi:RNA 3'-terminal phosphate cyclase-like protein
MYCIYETVLKNLRLLLAKVIRRGCQPKGGGLVQFTAPIIRQQLQPIYIIDEGLVKRVRGVAFSSKISPTIAGFTTF